MARKKSAAKPESKPVPVDAIKHHDTRSNIPTRQNQGMLPSGDEAKPPAVRYPRDPSLDPQLVWKGKDHQDAADLEVPAPPIYIQEKVHPQAIIEDIRQRAHAGRPKPADLFSDFNGVEESKRTEFYRHPQHWSNRMILGDSLMVMASLAEKEQLRGRVQMVYIDPPYGIKFGSNWQVSTRKRDVKDGKLTDLTAEREVIRAFRDTWEYGIHSYLKVWRDRLTAARDLLTESGSIFVQIGDENVHLVRCLMDEVFGSENFVSLISYKKAAGLGAERLSNVCDYIVWYAKNQQFLKYHPLYLARELGSDEADHYSSVEEADGTRRPARAEDAALEGNGIRHFRPQLLTSQRPAGEGDVKSFQFNGKPYTPGAGTYKTDLNGLTRLAQAGRLLPTGKTLSYLRYHDDFPVYPLMNAGNRSRG